MEIKYITKGPLIYLQVIDVFNKEDEQKIIEELNEYYSERLYGKDIGAASDEKGNLLRYNGSGVNLSEDKYFDKSFTMKKMLEVIGSKAWSEIHKVHCSFSILSSGIHELRSIATYTENEGGYKAHKDYSNLTAIYYNKKGSFTGGELVFTDYDEKIIPEPNSMVIFSGAIQHEVLPVKCNEGDYRISINNFIL